MILPVSSLNFPAWQLVQALEASISVKVPLGHSVQAVLEFPCVLNNPLLHGRQPVNVTDGSIILSV
jgi:predicted amidohydrolase